MELIVNGKNIGRQTMPKNGHLKWNATYQPGRIVAYGYKNGKRILTETVETTKPAFKTVLKADRSQISADGRDLAVITVEVQDQKGRIVPDACPELTFTLSGNGRILGAGNGDPSYPGLDHPNSKDCQQFTIPAFNGLAQLLVQSTDAAGTLQLTCTSEGLKPSTLQISTKSWGRFH